MIRMITIVAVLVIWGCELFQPRDAEPPGDTNDPYTFVQPTTPEFVLDDISNAFPASKQDYYLDVLVQEQETDQSFKYEPDPGVAQNHGGLFDNWGFAEEESFITNLFQRMTSGGLQSFQWSDLQLTTLDDQTQIQADYNIQLSLNISRDELPAELAGRAYLTLIRGDDQLYRILLWADQDISSDTLICWSEFKAGLE